MSYCISLKEWFVHGCALENIFKMFAATRTLLESKVMYAVRSASSVLHDRIQKSLNEIIAPVM
eukprot:1923-Karenia_brevis.AAC.1